MRERYIIGVDLDGTMCVGQSFTEDECINAVPIHKVIDRVNELSKCHYIIIYTARKYNLSTATLRWLDKWMVEYDAISFKKIPVDILIDDTAMNVKDFIKKGIATK